MRLRSLFWWLACLTILAGFGVLWGLRSYQVFTHEEQVAIVRCEAAPKGAQYRFLIGVAPVQRGAPSSMRSFPLQGDQWSIGGDILKWHPWLNLVGIRSCHRLTRVSGRYLKAEDEVNKPRSAYDLNGGTDPFWRWLYRHGQWIPFVEAVYGNAAYTMAQPGTQWGVYVTVSGYLIKPLRKNA